jgi:indole-3-glycerol phosphate synthase
MSILHEIFANKQKEVQLAKQGTPPSRLETQVINSPTPLDFASALKNFEFPAPRLIAEVKYKSPSKGVFRRDFDPKFLAHSYAQNGAAAISVLTDEKYFGGNLRTLRQIHGLGLGIPLLRKDFIFDHYQLLEARVYGASAVLLIVAMLDQKKLINMIGEAGMLDLGVLVEVHNEGEMVRALEAGAKIIGINNRNLHDFSVNLDTSLELASISPKDIVTVSESGIKDLADIELLTDAGVDAILVGESLVRAEDVGLKVRGFTRVGVQ